ncbi:hypothetical protein ACVJH7_009302 [Bradyrhizobium elkanii]
MPFPLSVFLFSYVIWQASIEQAFTLNPAYAASAP